MSEAHIPVLLDETIGVLAPRDDALYLDGTFGFGGYSRALLEAARCRVVAIDRDPAAVQRADDLARDYAGRLVVVGGRFGEMERLLSPLGIARLNGVAGLVRPVVARGLGHPALQAGAPYDLVFANILARPLRKLAPAIAALLAPNGEIILSGLLACDVAGVVSAYRAQGLALSWRLDIDGWATLMMRAAAAVRPIHASASARSALGHAPLPNGGGFLAA